MKKLLLFIIVSFITINTTKAQTHLYSWSYCTFVSNRNKVKIEIKNGFVLIDEIKNKISIPQLNIHFTYEHLEKIGGHHMYIKNDFGQLIIADNLSMMRFEYFTGEKDTYEFMIIKSIIEENK